MPKRILRKPDWLKVQLPGGERYGRVRRAVKDGELHTVCQEARCPNLGACWESGAATFMILGETCTRGCQFCAVGRGNPGGELDEAEARRVAETVSKMGLDYAVITSVTRDDLPDGGASVFAATVAAIKALDPPPLVELLIPDLDGADLDAVMNSGADVVAHNIEVIERLTPRLRHRRFSYDRSLAVLEGMKRRSPDVLTKSSIMLGLGETGEEIHASMSDLRRVEVDILVLGQYLQPTRTHAEVVEYVHPDRFDELADHGREMGFGFVTAGPLVRTSYKAAEAYARHALAR